MQEKYRSLQVQLKIATAGLIWPMRNQVVKWIALYGVLDVPGWILTGFAIIGRHDEDLIAEIGVGHTISFTYATAGHT